MSKPPVADRIPLVPNTTEPAVVLAMTLPNSIELVLVMERYRATVTLIVDTAVAAITDEDKHNSATGNAAVFNRFFLIIYSNTQVVTRNSLI